MKNLDIDAILGAMENKQTQKTAMSFMELLAEADKVLAKIEGVLARVDRMGLKPLLVRGIGAKLGIDAESPLKPEFKSPTHQKIISNINEIPEEELIRLEQLKAGAKDGEPEQ